MKLTVFEDRHSDRLYPMTLTRPACDLRCGHTKLSEKISRAAGQEIDGYIVRDYLAESFAGWYDISVNNMDDVDGDLLLVNGRVLAIEVTIPKSGDDEVGWVTSERDDTADSVAYIRASAEVVSAAKSKSGSPLEFVENLASALPRVDVDWPIIDWPWDLIHQNRDSITDDFVHMGKHGVEGDMHSLSCVYGPEDQAWIAPTARIHPLVCLDTHGGPIIIEDGVEVHPNTRIEGPCAIGRDTLIVGAKIREGCSFGPMCRVGGEVEESIIQGYSNKYHDGFLGHSYVGEWVNLGANTTNSDLKNDYGSVDVPVYGEGLEPGTLVHSYDTKVGSFIGDHTKTSIGTLFNTGSNVGAMCLIMATGQPLLKFVPTGAWFIGGVVTKGFGYNKLTETAKAATSRRGRSLSEADIAVLNHIREITKSEFMAAVKKGRRTPKKS